MRKESTKLTLVLMVKLFHLLCKQEENRIKAFARFQITSLKVKYTHA